MRIRVHYTLEENILRSLDIGIGAEASPAEEEVAVAHPSDTFAAEECSFEVQKLAAAVPARTEEAADTWEQAEPARMASQK